MEESQIPPRPRPGRRSAPPREEATSEDVRKRFQELYGQYVNALQDAHQNLQRSYGKAMQSYAETLQSELSSIGAQEPFRQYMEGAQTAWKQQDAGLYAETNRKYVEAIQETQVALQQSYDDAVRNYAEALQQLWRDGQQQLQDAYLTYVRSLKDVWTQVDADSIDAATLATVAQTVLLAAACANITVAPMMQT